MKLFCTNNTSIITLVIIALIFILSPGASAQTFYISNGGSDANDGESELTPWQTLDKINSLATAQVEGATILFKRGDTFRGTVELKGDPENTTFGAYGSGENPVISGSVEITGWSVYSDSVFVADVGNLIEPDRAIHHLFVNGKLMTIARYPNVDASDKGWLQTGDSVNKSSFSDQALTENPRNAQNYWVGANVRIRTFSWLFEIRKVAGYSSDGTITMDSALTQTMANNIQPGWGYYLDNKLSELDHEEEWFFDEAAGKVYLYAPGGQNPNELLVEGSVHETGIKLFWHDHRATVENLTFKHQTVDGININQCDFVTIRNNNFESCEKTGINVAWNSIDMKLENNNFRNMLDCAIAWNANIPAGTDAWMKNNTITDTALIPGYGADGVGRSIAVRIYGTTGIQMVNNTIENTGYVGVILGGDGQIIENNVIKGSLLTLDDGGGILVNSHNNRITGNHISESFGNRDVSSGNYNGNSFRQMGMGIFFQPELSGNIIENNTIANNVDFGIYPDRANNTIIRNNTCYNNGIQLYLRGHSGDVAGNDYKNTIENNLLYSLSLDQVCMRTDPEFILGSFDNNRYYNPYTDITIKEDNDYISLEQWQALYPDRDTNSHSTPVHFDEYVVSNLGAEQMENSEFIDNVSNWNGNDRASVSFDSQKAEMDNGSLKVTVSGGSDSSSIRPGEVTLVQGEFYQFSFSSISNTPSDLKVTFFREDIEGGWFENLQYRFAIYPFRQENSVIFQWPFQTTSQTRPFFSVDDENPVNYWLDNVSLKSVDAVENNAMALSRLFSNTTPTPMEVDLGGVIYEDLEGTAVTGSITLNPFSSIILTRSSSSPPPAPPLQLTIDRNHVALSWTAVPYAIGYYLAYLPYPHGHTIGYIDVEQTTDISFDLPVGSAYYVAVQTYNDHGAGEFSNIEFFQID